MAPPKMEIRFTTTKFLMEERLIFQILKLIELLHVILARGLKVNQSLQFSCCKAYVIMSKFGHVWWSQFAHLRSSNGSKHMLGRSSFCFNKHTFFQVPCSTSPGYIIHPDDGSWFTSSSTSTTFQTAS